MACGKFEECALLNTCITVAVVVILDIVVVGGGLVVVAVVSIVLYSLLFVNHDGGKSTGKGFVFNGQFASTRSGGET